MSEQPSILNVVLKNGKVVKLQLPILKNALNANRLKVLKNLVKIKILKMV